MVIFAASQHFMYYVIGPEVVRNLMMNTPFQIRYALFEPLNWIYDSCLTDQEFEEKVRS